MLVLPVFLTRHSSIKVRRENDCKDKTQILKIKKKTILSNFNNNNRSVYQIPIYSCLLARIFNPQPFRSNICFLRYLLLLCFLLCFLSQPAAQVQAVFFGPMQPVPLSDFSALLLSSKPWKLFPCIPHLSFPFLPSFEAVCQCESLS